MGFEEFWAAFPRKHNRQLALAEWERISPGADLVAQIVATATRWADHYLANGTDAKYRPLPHNWLRDRRWLEDLPIPFSTKVTPTARPPTRWIGNAVVEAMSEPVLDGDNGLHWFDVRFRYVDGDSADVIGLSCVGYPSQHYDELVAAAGVEDADGLVGRRVGVVWDTIDQIETFVSPRAG